jgi:hypothetical protein
MKRGILYFYWRFFLYMVDKCNGRETNMWQQGAVTKANDPTEFTGGYDVKRRKSLKNYIT